MAGRCMFYLTFIWFSGAAYNVWQLVLNTSCYVPIALNSNVTHALGLPLYPPKPVVDTSKLDTDKLPLSEIFSLDSEMLPPPDSLSLDKGSTFIDHMVDHPMNFTTQLGETTEEVYSIKQCGAYQHFRSLHIGFYIADILVIHIIPIMSLTYLYISMLYHVIRTDGFSDVQNWRRIVMSVFFVVIFYICYLPLEFIDTKIVDSDLLTRDGVVKRKVIETWTFTHGVLVVIVYLLMSKEVVWLIQKQRSCQLLHSEIKQHGNSVSHDTSSNQKECCESPTNQKQPFIPTTNEKGDNITQSDVYVRNVPNTLPVRKGFIQTEL